MQLRQLRAPSDVELDLLGDARQPLASSKFGSLIEGVAAELASGLRPTQLPGNVGDGMELVVRWLNSKSSEELEGFQ